MDLRERAQLDLISYKKTLDKALEQYFDGFASKIEPPFTDKNIQAVIDAMISLILRGGKRIRGTLVKYAHDAITEQESGAILDLSMATEIIHGYLLIADDIMDRDTKRRGGPTVHKILEEYYEKEYAKNDKEHVGLSLALMSFTLANHIAFEIVSDLQIQEKIRIAILKHLHETIRLTVYGQILDMATEFENSVVPEQVINVHKNKTAYYTFKNPLMTGAILAGASKAQIKALNNYAMNVGIAFQLRDDILGMYGDEEKIGKAVNSDIREGKKTMLIVKALELGGNKVKDFIKRKLGKPGLSKEDLDDFRKITKETGSLNYSQELIEKYIKKGKNHLIKEKHLFKKQGYEFLLGIADYIGSREK